MPELPEVETTRKGLEPLVIARKVLSVHLYKKKLRWDIPLHLKCTLKNQKIKEISRRAKYLLFQFKNEIDKNNITVIGHSRGGGISILKASEDSRITKLITWASVSSFGKRTSTTGNLKQWKKEGVKYVLNGRTKQQMPHNYQFYLDYKANEKRFNIEAASNKLEIPFLIIHATDDPSVKFNEALALHKFNSSSQLIAIDNSNHVFNAKHPWQENNLPKALKTVVEKSIEFISN